MVAGRTGSGKTRLLQALREQGAQVLDLEALACHRGSVLGGLPDTPQPSQKAFDTQLWHALRALDPARPVFVESESKKVGALQLPDALVARMRDAQPLPARGDERCGARASCCCRSTASSRSSPSAFATLLDALVELQGKERVKRWQAMARAGQWAEVFDELMREHYDPLYERSMQRNFAA